MSFSQNDKLLSIQDDLETSRNLLEKSLQATNEFQLALTYAESALNILTKYAYLEPSQQRQEIEFQKARILKQLAKVHQESNINDAALAYSFQALSIFERINEPVYISDMMTHIGIAYFNMGDFTKAMSFYQNALTIVREHQDKSKESGLLLNIANIYSDSGDSKKALEILETVIVLKEAHSDKLGRAFCLANIGTQYGRLNDFENAAKYFERALKEFTVLNYRRGQANTLLNIGITKKNSNEYDQALLCLEEAILMARDCNDKRTEALCLLSISECFFTTREFEKAEKALLEALDLSQRYELRYEEYETLNQLATLYAEMNHHEKAYSFLHQCLQVQNWLTNSERNNKLREAQVALETEVSRRETEIQRKKNDELALALKEAQTQKERAEEANRFKTELLGIAAHDLKNPLQSIMGFAQLLKLKKDEAEAVNKYAETIERASSRMLSIITDLLAGVKLETSELRIQKSQVNLSELVVFIVQNNLAQASAKAQRIETEIEANCIVEGDMTRLYEVFENLTSNAIKYSPKGKSITLQCQRRESEILISVKDEGQGLTEADKAKLFGRFQRLSAQPTGGESSTGLGLSIVKQIVELHGGRVWAESEGAGKGATFFVELPIRRNGD